MRPSPFSERAFARLKEKAREHIVTGIALSFILTVVGTFMVAAHIAKD
jgi:hypothetical protein